MNRSNQQKTVVIDLIPLFVLVLWTIQLFLLIRAFQLDVKRAERGTRKGQLG